MGGCSYPADAKSPMDESQFWRGYPQKEVAEASYQFQRAAEAKEKIIVGANEFVIEEEPPNILYIDESVARHQSAKLKALRGRRSNEEVRRRLDTTIHPIVPRTMPAVVAAVGRRLGRSANTSGRAS
jgi:methylmalonyl-CoA mutase N-terminal domain/subunit